MIRPHGMHPNAFRAWIDSCMAARVNPEIITQTMGTSVAASAGTHAQDGVFITQQGIKVPYSAAFDVSCKTLSVKQINTLLACCAQRHIIGWHRTPDEGNWAEHLHLIFLGCAMKESLQNQVHDWFHDKSGLKGHKPEKHVEMTMQALESCRQTFLHYNPS